MRFLFPLLFVFISACSAEPGGGLELARLGFYEKNTRVIEELSSRTERTPAGEYRLGRAFSGESKNRLAVLHFARSAFLEPEEKSLRHFPDPVLRYLRSWNRHSPYYEDALLHIARLYYRYGEDKAVVELSDMMDRDDPYLYGATRMLRAKSLLRMKRKEEAIRTLSELVSDREQSPRHNLIRIRLGSALQDAGREREGEEQFWAVLEDDSSSWEASIALRQLSGKREDLPPARRLLLARASFHAGRYSQARDILSALYGEGLRCNMTMELFVRVLAAGRWYREAEGIISERDKNGNSESLNLIMADELWKRGRESRAAGIYRERIQKKKKPSLESLYRYALWAEERKRDRYRERLRAVTDNYRETGEAAASLWLMVRDDIRNDRVQSVLRLTEEYLKHYPRGKEADRCLYWHWRFRPGEEKYAYRLVAGFPNSSYTWLYLTSQQASTEGKDGDLFPGDREIHNHILKLYRQGALQDGGTKERDRTFPGHEYFQKLDRALFEDGLSGEEKEVYRLFERYFASGDDEMIGKRVSFMMNSRRQQKGKLYRPLAALAVKYGHYHRMVLYLIRTLEEDDMKENVFFMSSRLVSSFYPRAFHWCVRESVKKRKVTPATLYAVMRAESLFHHDALSPAGAVGLMQLMPATARGLARQMGMKSYDLKKPCTSVKFGAHYLDWLDRYLDGNIVRMMAGYNAGPGNAKKWLEKYGSNIADDLFIEKVPYDETRYYMLRTRKFREIYRMTSRD